MRVSRPTRPLAVLRCPSSQQVRAKKSKAVERGMVSTTHAGHSHPVPCTLFPNQLGLPQVGLRLCKLPLAIAPQEFHVVGPGAGDAGGRIVATGTPPQVAQAPDSRTAPYLAAELARAGLAVWHGHSGASSTGSA